MWPCKQRGCGLGGGIWLYKVLEAYREDGALSRGFSPTRSFNEDRALESGYALTLNKVLEAYTKKDGALSKEFSPTRPFKEDIVYGGRIWPYNTYRVNRD